MGENTSIEWADHSWNPWIGCTKVSAACDFCYAEVERATKALGVAWGAGQPRHRTSLGNWRQPLRWAREAAAAGRRDRVFTASLADVFDVEVGDEWRDDLFALICATPALDWLVLTKRPKVMRDYLLRRYANPGPWLDAAERLVRAKVLPPNGVDLVAAAITVRPLVNLWCGTTVEDQPMADLRIPLLLETPAVRRFLSMEPLLGLVDIERHLNGGLTVAEWEARALSGTDPYGFRPAYPRIDWVIVGGESGPHARPMHPDWVRLLRNLCATAGVAFFMKQWGEWKPHAVRAGGNLGDDVRAGRVRIVHPTGEDEVAVFNRTGINTIPGSRYMARVGKKAAGRLLDGVLHDAVPPPLGMAA